MPGSLWCNMLHVHGEEIYFGSFRDYPAQIINWHDRETGPLVRQEGLARAMCGGLSRSSLVFSTAETYKGGGVWATPIAQLVLSTGCVVPLLLRGNDGCRPVFPYCRPRTDQLVISAARRKGQPGRAISAAMRTE
jgi:hypothetical protein